MKQISNTQRAYLRNQAHHLKPVVQIGKNGLTEEVQTTIDQVLSARELIKVKFLDFRDQKQQIAEQIAAASGSLLIGIIGNIAILYREQPDPERRKVALPA